MMTTQFSVLCIFVTFSMVTAGKLDDLPASKNDLHNLKEDILVFVKQELTHQERVIVMQGATIADQDDTIAKLKYDMQAIQKDNVALKDMLSRHPPLGINFDVSYNSSAYGCDLDVLTLTCDNTTHINVTSAYYGQYITGCSGCCPPGPGDCTEIMAENRPSDWLALKYTCDARSTCEYQNLGSLLESCESPYDAHYLVIYYDCIQEDSVQQDVVAFSAYATETRDYSEGEVVLFDGIVTNVGNHYDPLSGIFTCQRDGVFVFSVSVAKFAVNSATGINIMHEDIPLLTSYAGSATHEQGSSTTVIECKSGERVWGEAHFNTITISGNTNDRTSSFTGFLLHAY